MQNIIQEIYKSIDFKLPLVVCVSGGKDSVCLLHIIMKYKDEFCHTPEVIHFNHGLRKESMAEEIFIEKLCKKFNIPYNIFRFNVKEYAAQEDLSIEEAARILRYRKLAEYTSEKKEMGCILTAHTASDQLETVIFRLIKGTGLSGLIGIRKEMKLQNGWIIKRPLLTVPVNEVQLYLKENKIGYCIDKSNSNTKIPRNFIRHHIVKYFKKLNPSIEKSVTKAASIWAEEEDYLKKKVEEAVSGIKIERKDKKIYIELSTILSYNEWLQRRILRLLAPTDLNYNKINALTDLIYKAGASSYIELGSSWMARKEYNNLIFERELPRCSSFEYDILPDREYYLEEIGKSVKMELIGKYIAPVSRRDIEIFDADELNLDNLKVRSRKKGDRISPIGMTGRKKIKDVCIDLKLVPEKRNDMAVFAEGNKVLWAAPYKRSNIAAVKKDTKRVLKIEIADGKFN